MTIGHFSGKVNSGYPVCFESFVNSMASKHLNISYIENKGIWGLMSMLGSNVQWMTGFYHKQYGKTNSNFWPLYVNLKVKVWIILFTERKVKVLTCLPQPKLLKF
jgi:hypothetical protein